VGAPRGVDSGSMRWLRRPCSVAVFLCLGFATLAPGAVAQDDDGPDPDDQVVLTGRLVVAEDETVQTAVIFNGDAVIDGTVAEWLVVFNGRTEITGTVGEDVVVFDGDDLATRWNLYDITFGGRFAW
jgi:hypothetical protein